MIAAPDTLPPLTLDRLESVPPAGWVERAFLNLPLLCGISDGLSRDRHSEVEKAYKDQMAARPEIPPEWWGDSDERQSIAKVVCEECREGMGWPNARYVPEDSLRIVFYFGVYDCLDGIDTTDAIFEKLGILADFQVLDPIFENPAATMLDLVLFCEQSR